MPLERGAEVCLEGGRPCRHVTSGRASEKVCELPGAAVTEYQKSSGFHDNFFRLTVLAAGISRSRC